MNDERRRHGEHSEREPVPLLAGPSCTPDAYGHCVTCSDEALEGRVLSVDDGTSTALVAIGDASGEVDISLVDNVVPGAVLLIHGGVAIGRL